MCSCLFRQIVVVLVIVLPLVALMRSQAAADSKGVPDFRVQEIEKSLGVGYAVLLVDVNGDGKKDIVVVDHEARRLVREPHLEATDHHRGPDQAGQRLHRRRRHRRRRPARLRPRAPTGSPATPSRAAPCNGSSAARRSTSRGPSTRSARSRRCTASASPTSTAAANPPCSPCRSWAATAAVRRTTWTASRCAYSPIAFRKIPCSDRWPPEVIDESMHVMHNFWPIPAGGRQGHGHSDRQL